MNQQSRHTPPIVGGQAVIEGVMMRFGEAVATAVRRTDGSIAIQRLSFRSLARRFPVFRAPLLRGAVGLVEMMVIGIRTLNYSAEVSLTAEGTEVPVRRNSSWKLGVTVAVSLLIGVLLFFATPLVLTSMLFEVDQQPMMFNMTAGVIRVGLLLGYLTAISLSAEIRRVFEYHGAEHKAVFAFENGEPLTVDSVARQSRFHPRCGTSFILIVMLSSILLFSVLDTILIAWLGELTLPVRLLTHLPLIPLVGGISYEFIRASAKRSRSLPGRLIAAPGLWLQRITTREPDEGQLEVAITALEAALGDTQAPVSENLRQEAV